MVEREKPFEVLFLCTGNSARSVMAEAYLNFASMGRFRAHSAGSKPRGSIHPMALETLNVAKLATDGLRSKDWAEFAGEDAPDLDFVFTLCDRAAAEECPVWPGQPMTAHWPFPDPAAFDGPETEQRALFLDVFRQVRTRIDIFTNLPIASLDRLSLQKRLEEIGQSEPQPA